MIWIKNHNEIKKKLKIIFTLFTVVLSIFCAINYSKECSKGVINGISFCVSVLIPSLFLFMIIASYISNSVISKIIGTPFERLATKLLNLPNGSSGVLILSLIGGYPIGARCIESLYLNNKLNEEQAKKLSLVAVSSGPGFVMNYVGEALLNSNKAGVILFVSQIIGFFTTALIIGRCVKIKDDSVVIKQEDSNGSFVDAVEKGCKSTVSMCAMVIVFSAIIEVINKVVISQPLSCDVLSGILEVTTGCNRLSLKYPLHIISAVIGFGGICVHAQVFSALKSVKINKGLFFLSRIIQGITSGFSTYILLILFPISIDVFSSVEKTIPTTKTPLVGSIALILTAVCFLNSTSKINLKRR